MLNSSQIPPHMHFSIIVVLQQELNYIKMVSSEIILLKLKFIEPNCNKQLTSRNGIKL